MPAIGFEQFSWDAWNSLIAHPSTAPAIGLSLLSGWLATLGALLSTLIIIGYSYGGRWWRLLERFLAPMLAVPHAAIAIALLFVLAPSGWLIRLISPELSGWEYPPSLGITQDRWGLSLAFALWLKEVPYLLFVSMALLNPLKMNQSLLVGQSLGYSRIQIWRFIIVPQLLPRLRLPLFAVLAFSISVVDIAQIIGPSRPGTFAVLVWQWFNDSDLNQRLLGAAGALSLLVLVLFSLAFAYLLERFTIKMLMRQAMASCPKLQGSGHWGRLHGGLMLLFFSLSAVVLILWSFAHRWRFPDIFPQSWSLRFWSRAFEYSFEPLLYSLSLALCSAFVGLILSLVCLENEVRLKRSSPSWSANRLMWIMYLPLFVPQIAFLFGVQTQLLAWRLDGRFIGVFLVHLIFVLPYVFLTLAESYRNFDQRYMDAAISLCHKPRRAYFQVKLQLLFKPLCLAFATGFAVSIAQYLPTQFAGAGRITTLTTEAVALASGGDRRVTAVVVILQCALPLFIYALAILLPKYRFRHRLAMQG
ncbi:hypothetical protein DBZ36_15585 [Alginatibacterium sediminis]|uniref:ABC transmembrane type-1 domain-containing protein n=2 Tax=Alginatibacterium sediminis TaxID=2164068 RepID=A0A420E924_9ALTE|nr:hypothetical protein DBZ36_15585 [Alginatibacterium sediminis]